jgi:hypothetical protein
MPQVFSGQPGSNGRFQPASLRFSLRPGNSHTETGSLQTASTANSEQS